MSEKGPEGTPKDPRLNEDLARELRQKLDDQVDEGSEILNQSGEHQAAVDELLQKRVEEDPQRTQALRNQALRELASESGVAPSDQLVVQRKMAEIAAREQE